MTSVTDATATPALAERSASGLPRVTAGLLGTILLSVIAIPCIVTLRWSIRDYNDQQLGLKDQRTLVTAVFNHDPATDKPLGTFALFGRDELGRSMTMRCMLGGAISLGIGLAAAMISLVIGVAWGATAGYVGGRVDSAMMRIVDVLYGLPYILLVVLIDLALKPPMVAIATKVGLAEGPAESVGEVVTLLMAIGGVSWLTMARVIRGQVLSLRSLPFIEAARAAGASPVHIMVRHLLPNLVGPIVVYTTLTVPQAILQESFLSFLGIGVQVPLPSWGNLASDGLKALTSLGTPGAEFRWWLIVWPCVLLGLTLLALNYLGDALRNRVDPKSVQRR